MSTHGHRFIADLIYGSVANGVRHMTSVPVLLLRAPAATKQKVAAT
jgi:nucleotide-binding universal stress UspA family protein